MRILLTIGHPAHVHYFRNFIRIMESKGHRFLIMAKNRNVTFKLLEYYDLPFIKRKDYPKSIIRKLLNVPLTDVHVMHHALKFKADMLMGFSGTFIAHAGKFLNIPSVVIDDTEHANLAHASYKPFARHILTPTTFNKDLGRKQLKFEGYMELCYLHPNYFTPDPSILDLLGVKKGERFVILRFVSWGATHDVGHSGMSLEMKRKAVKKLTAYAKVFISSEKELPDDLMEYQIKIPPHRMHDALFYADLLYGESATMASECACLGTPSIFIDNSGRGYTDEEEQKYGLVFNFSESLDDQERSIEQAILLMKDEGLKDKWQAKTKKMLSDKIDVTAFFVWFFQNYPESYKEMSINSESSQVQFRP